jgi:hypothetical protein
MLAGCHALLCLSTTAGCISAAYVKVRGSSEARISCSEPGLWMGRDSRVEFYCPGEFVYSPNLSSQICFFNQIFRILSSES